MMLIITKTLSSGIPNAKHRIISSVYKNFDSSQLLNSTIEKCLPTLINCPKNSLLIFCTALAVIWHLSLAFHQNYPF